MVDFTNRERWIAGGGRRSVEDARRKAAANTPEVMMSQSADWYQNRENLARAKDVLENISAVTTNQDESRNMYQMLINQMKGGDRGARLIDTSGLPEGARRYGSTLFTDPAKSQGIMGDFGSLLSGRSKSAVRAPVYNPFPPAGFGKKFYHGPVVEGDPTSGLGGRDWGEMLEGILKLATPLKYFKGKERIPLERDPRFTPVHGSADWESSIFDLTGDYDVDTGYGWEDEGLSAYGGEPSYNDPITITDLMGPDPIYMPDEIEETTETFTDLGDTHEFTEESRSYAGDYVDVQEYVNSIIQDEGNPYYKMDQDELVKILIKQNRIKEKESESLEDINLTEDDFEGVAFDFDKNLEDQAESLNEIERLKNIQRDNNFLFDI